tara:strand:- start:3632 stop:4015 length:384 start_codon:yes stop_codon:yes gene_type:complete
MSSIKATKESIEYCEEALQILRNDKSNFGLIKAGDVAGKAIEIAGTNLLHSLSYPLTGNYNISHGIALGYLLPRLSKFMGFNVDDIISEYKIELEFNKELVIKEAFKYDKINEFNKEISKEILYEKL